MIRNIPKKSSEKQPTTGRVPLHDMHGTEHKGIVICPECRNFRYKKSWHNVTYLYYYMIREKKDRIRYDLCPACKTIKQHLFAGEIYLNNFPVQYDYELIKLVHTFGERAKERDPQDRIIAINKVEKGYHITTTEDQLAVKLAKKIIQVFKAVDSHISYSPEPSRVSRVKVDFLSSN